MTTARIGPVADRAAFHAAVATALDLPAWYGANLDALADCLRGVDPTTVVAWTGWRTLAAADPDFFTTVVGLLGDRLDLRLLDPPDHPGGPDQPGGPDDPDPSDGSLGRGGGEPA